ncbi:MAG: hypothetical protein ACYC7D_07300 [Nitrososphaerales archaeon]
MTSAKLGTVRHGDSKARRYHLRDLAEGFLWLKKNKGLLYITISALFLNSFFTMAFAYVVFSTCALHQDGLVMSHA